jgi:hypothetical protein
VGKDGNDFEYFRDRFIKRWKCEKIIKFLPLVKLPESRFFFERTHKNAPLMLQLIVLETLFEKISQM